MEFIKRLRGNLSLALDLAAAQAVFGDWRYVRRWYEEVEKVSLEDVKRVASLYLQADKRIVARLESGKRQRLAR